METENEQLTKDVKPEKKSGFLKGFVCGLLIPVILGGVFLYVTGLINVDLRQILKQQEIMRVIESKYYNEVDARMLEDNMFAGMLSGLDDKYSVYYTEEEVDKILQSSSGVYYGIGCIISQHPETGEVVIVKPYDDSPAQEAGLEPGDIIYKVEEKEVNGMDLSSVVTLIQGQEGSTVHITIVREGEADFLEFDVERRNVEVPTIGSTMLEDQIGYIQIAEFDEVTVSQFQKALADLENQGMEGLVVDLRDNGGGVLSAVCNMLSEILPEGLIVYTEDKNGRQKEYSSDGRNEIQVPMVVLVNGNTASASEIFAGAVQDYQIGTIVGTTTFGKGIVQEIIRLKDGSAVKVTTSKYYTPNGNDIHGTGIEPDVEIELDKEAETDNQLERAIVIINEQR